MFLSTVKIVFTKGIVKGGINLFQSTVVKSNRGASKEVPYISKYDYKNNRNNMIEYTIIIGFIIIFLMAMISEPLVCLFIFGLLSLIGIFLYLTKTKLEDIL